MAGGQGEQREAERLWFEGRVGVVRLEAQAWLPDLYDEGLRLPEIERDADQLVRAGILMEAEQERPDGLVRLLSRLLTGDPLEAALRELFRVEVPLGAAIAALMGVSLDDPEDVNGVGVAIADEIRRPQRQAEANGLGPTNYVWEIGMIGRQVLLVAVQDRESAGALWFRLVRVTNACELFTA